MRILPKLFVLTCAVLSCLTLAKSADASTILITSRVALAGDDFVNWAVLGGVNTNPSNPFSTSSNDGLNVTGSQTQSGPFQRFDQGNGWGGNFAPGDALLWTNNPDDSTSNTMTLDFASSIAGGGAQIQTSFLGNFVARITALDAASNVLGSYTLAGTSTTAGDNSAIFLGILSDASDIDKIQFSLDSAPFGRIGDFAINQVDLVTSQVAPVPEPATLALVTFGLAEVARRRIRRRSS